MTTCTALRMGMAAALYKQEQQLHSMCKHNVADPAQQTKLARACAGVGKVTCVFDLEGYGASETVMPPFQARLPCCTPRLCIRC